MTQNPNVVDPKEKQKQQDEYFRKMKVDYEKVFNSPEGKRVLADLSRSCFYNRTFYTNDSLDLANNEGKRFVYLHIHAMATPVPSDGKQDKPKEAITK